MSIRVLAAASCCSPLAHGQPDLAQLDARSLLLDGTHLYVAGERGGIWEFDAGTQSLERRWSTQRPVRSMRVIDGHPFWVVENSRAVCEGREDGSIQEIDVPSSLIQGPIERISGWRGKVVVQGEYQFAFVDPLTYVVCRPRSVLPDPVARVAEQGVVDCFWRDGKGIFVSVRRYEKRLRGQGLDDTEEIASVTAWSGYESGDLRLLGSYKAPVALFHDAPGPDVEDVIHGLKVTQRFGAADLGNFKIGPEGVIALGAHEEFAVPFYQDNWLPNRISTAFHPRFPSNVDYSQESVWWCDRSCVYRADISDGSTQAFTPQDESETIRQVAADERGAWVATDRGVRRIDLEATGPEWAQATASASEAICTHEQFLLTRAIRTSPGQGDGAAGRPAGTIQSLIEAAGGRISSAKRVDEGEVGDLVKSNGGIGIYLGGGKVLKPELGSICVCNLKPSRDLEFERVLPRSPLRADDIDRPSPAKVSPKPFTPTPRPRIWIPEAPRHRDDDITPLPPISPELDWSGALPVGVNHPKPSLRNSDYVYCDPSSPYDHPYLETHHRLMQEALGWIGSPYRWGGNSKNGVDCSGFVCAVFRELGVRLPRYSQDIGRARRGKYVKGQLHFGDVLVFQSPKHVALYVGGGRTIEAVGGGVGFSTIYRRSQAVVRRFLF